MSSDSNSISSVLNRPLVFVHGKGGVGKTSVSHAIGLGLSRRKIQNKTLWVTLEDPTLPQGSLQQIGDALWHLNCDFMLAFEEYASMKIRIPQLTRVFLRNKVIRYLAKAAPGVRDLVLLGKIWFERTHYSHVIVDMPSTGYGLALFQSTQNFAHLFKGGPLHRDAEEILVTLGNSEVTGHLILALPEEMPLRESLELNDYLRNLFPNNEAAFLVNRIFPFSREQGNSPIQGAEEDPVEGTPLVRSGMDYIKMRARLEQHNLRLWREHRISFGELSYVPPLDLPNQLAVQLEDRNLL